MFSMFLRHFYRGLFYSETWSPISRSDYIIYSLYFTIRNVYQLSCPHFQTNLRPSYFIYSLCNMPTLWASRKTSHCYAGPTISSNICSNVPSFIVSYAKKYTLLLYCKYGSCEYLHILSWHIKFHISNTSYVNQTNIDCSQNDIVCDLR